jgi:hypothetical protein
MVFILPLGHFRRCDIGASIEVAVPRAPQSVQSKAQHRHENAECKGASGLSVSLWSGQCSCESHRTLESKAGVHLSFGLLVCDISEKKEKCSHTDDITTTALNRSPVTKKKGDDADTEARQRHDNCEGAKWLLENDR